MEERAGASHVGEALCCFSWDLTKIKISLVTFRFLSFWNSFIAFFVHKEIKQRSRKLLKISLTALSKRKDCTAYLSISLRPSDSGRDVPPLC